MKIVILNWRDPKHPNAGGAEQSTLIHAQAWSDAGHEVTWFSSKVEGLPKYENYKNINIIRDGHYVFGVQLKAFLHLQKNKYDLVVDQIHGLPFFTPLYINKRKILAFIHEVTKDVVWHNPYIFPINKIVGLMASIAEPLIFRLFYRYVNFWTVSKSTKSDLRKWGVKKIKVIHNGITLPKSKKMLSKNKKFTILYLGAIAKDKGIDDAICVFKKLSKNYPDWNFWIAGKADKTYSKVLENLKINNFKYFGYVSENKKFKLLSEAHVLINPSIREGWGLVNLEAASMSTPTVGYEAPGMVDSVKNNKTGILVDKNNTNKLVNSIEQIYEDKKLYNTLSKNSKNWSNKFSWKKSTKQSLKLIEDLV